MPALIYLIFSFTHVVIDTYKGLYNTAIIEIWISAVFTLLLNLLCQQNLGIISWIIISIPFLLMTVIATLVLFVFKLNPATGQALTPSQGGTTSTPPSAMPTTQPSTIPTTPPSTIPTTQLSTMPTTPPSAMPTTPPSAMPTTPPSTIPTTPPSTIPTTPPSAMPTTQSQGLPQTIPSHYAYPVSVFYGSLGNYKPPALTH
jgi:hypothetical protein